MTASENTAINPYDEVPYTSYPHRQTHPERMATIATLFGLDTVPIDGCRVLDIGCAAGGNLLPMAERHPESEFVGIDLSANQIEEGQAAIKEVGLTNVRLMQQDLRSLPDELGKFDYILSHGVFSWIPDDAQEALLGAYQRLLSDRGIGYISYNTFPGWHMRGMIRDIMAYRASSFSTPQDRLGQARGLLQFLAESVTTENNPYGILLNNELKQLQGSEDSYLYHEYLEEFNEPVYFHQFMERAQRNGLQYVGEADFQVMSIENFPPQVKAMLHSIATDVVEMEQYMDFVRNRLFRQTILCRSDLTLERKIQPDKVLSMHVASSTKPEQEITSVANDDEVTFRTADSMTATTDPLMKAALLQLGEQWPQSIPFAELVALAKSRVMGSTTLIDSAQPTAEAARLAETMLRCYATGQVELSVSPPRFQRTVSERPQATPLARYQASHALPVTNLRHETVGLNEMQRHLVAQLDGTHDIDALVDFLIGLIENETLVLRSKGQVVTDRGELNRIVRDVIHHDLESFAARTLLVE